MGTYRYSLYRKWGEGKTMAFIGLNPSTADASKDDQTIRKVVGYARREGCGSLFMLNLFAYRSRDPKVLTVVEDPIGPNNKQVIQATIDQSQLVLVGWGSDKSITSGVIQSVLPASGTYYCLGINKDGNPKHPLYLAGNAPLLIWKRKEG